jgi:hypothetical protein
MIALNVFGPALKYRLDLLKKSSYNVRDYVHILTDKISYEKFYSEFHNDYTFVFVEDYMSQYELSVKHEIIPNGFSNEEDHFVNSSSFYKEKNNFFSFDIHRFIFPYFISKGIKKFAIVDSDLILTNKVEVVDEFFKSLPKKTFFAPGMGIDYNLEPKQKFWDSLNIDWVSNKFKTNNKIEFFDGWIRGFNFETIDDAQTFFDVWNTSYLQLLEQRDNPTVGIGKNGEGPLIWSNEWIFSHCVEIFCQLKGYTSTQGISFQPGIVVVHGSNPSKTFGLHMPRPEDNLFHELQKYTDENGVERYPSRGAWYDYRFDYSGKRTVESFIKNNKDELMKYYQNCNFDVRITDTHVYTKIKE